MIKRTIAALILAFVLTSNALAATGYYTGAWYDTKATKGTPKQAGQVDIDLYNDGTCDVTFYYASGVVRVMPGEWFVSKKGVWVSAIDPFSTEVGAPAWSFSGTINTTTGNGTGKHRRSDHSGKWQVDFVAE